MHTPNTPVRKAPERETTTRYEPPRATFVPLQIEERLMACSKKNSTCKRAGQHQS